MRNRRRIFTVMLVYLCFRTIATFAQGGPPPGVGPQPPQFELVTVSSTVNVDNPIFTSATAAINVTVGHTGGPGGYVITVSRGSSPTFDPREMLYQGTSSSIYDPLHYNIYTPDNDIAKDLSGPVSNNQVIRGTFGNSGSSFNTQQHAFEVRIPAEQFVQRGTYRDQVDVSLYEGRGLNAESLTLVGSETVTLTSETPIVAQISISGQSDYAMDFGILQSGASRSAYLQYRTNAGFSIDAMSENNGVMVNTMQPESVAVPYQLTLNGNLVDLTDSSVVGQDLLFGTTIDFESVPLNVTIGTLGQVLPGFFQDVITFTITTF